MSKLLIDDSPLVLLPSLATAIGLNEAVVLQQVHYWLRTFTAANSTSHYRDGRWWVYNTAGGWQTNFPFWSTRTIKRVLKSLRDKGLILTGRYNRVGYDKTLWYSIDYEVVDKLEQPIVTSCHHPSGQSVTIHSDRLSPPIPETTHETNTENTKTKTPDGDLPDDLIPEQDPLPEPVPPADDHSVRDHKDWFSMNQHCAEKREQNGGAPDWAMVGAEGTHRFYPILLAFCALTQQDPTLIKAKVGKRWLTKYEDIAAEHWILPDEMLQAHEFLPDKDRGAWYIQNHKWSTPYNDSYEEQLVLAAMQIKGGTIATKNGWSKAMS